MKSRREPNWVVAAMAVAAALALGPAAQAQTSSVEVHGFGGWAYANTDGNNYLIGNEEGTYDNLAFALNINAKVSDQLTVVGQFEFQQRPGFEDLDRTLDFAFAEWKLSDALRLRAGRVKHPFGIYGDVFSVGTLRPFYMLPQSIYGPERYTARSVDGVGITGQRQWDGGWGINYDVYAGRIAGELRISGIGSEVEDLNLGMLGVPFGFDEVLGARVNATLPVEGLTVGASVYRGEATGYYSVGAKEVAINVSAEYQTDRLMARSEYGTILRDPVVRFDTFYVETAYKVWRGLQLAARYDRWQGHLKDETLVGIPWIDAVQRHEDWVLGLNYWLSPNFVAKLNYHIVDGNRYAQPSDPTTVVTGSGMWDGNFEPRTNMLVLGAQFSF